MSGIVTNGLGLYFDISNVNSFDLNNEFTIKSLKKSNKTIIKNQNLLDFGLTQYDIGFSNTLTGNTNITNQDNTYFELYRIGDNGISGMTDYIQYGIDLITGSTVGNYFYSNGGYLNNSFKYHNYDIQYLPRRFDNGFTIETTIFIDENTFINNDNNSNFIILMGCRSEDKFSDSFTGNSDYVTSEGSILTGNNIRFGNLPQNTINLDELQTFLYTEKGFIDFSGKTEYILNETPQIYDKITVVYNDNIIPSSGYTFNDRNNTIILNEIKPDIGDTLYFNYYILYDGEITLNNINLNEIKNTTVNKEYGIENNVIGYRFNQNKSIGFRYIDDEYNIIEDYSEDPIEYTGWTHVVLSFRPDEITNSNDIDDDCDIESRNGVFSIYVNGKKFYENKEFNEIVFNGFKFNRSKQIGIPYNLSWGGGSFGLKNSYNFNDVDFGYPYQKNIENNNLLIESNFDGYFKGGFQKLRIYERTLTFSEILNNYYFEADYYGIKYNMGGRIIYR